MGYFFKQGFTKEITLDKERCVWWWPPRVLVRTPLIIAWVSSCVKIRQFLQPVGRLVAFSCPRGS